LMASIPGTLFTTLRMPEESAVAFVVSASDAVKDSAVTVEPCGGVIKAESLMDPGPAVHVTSCFEISEPAWSATVCSQPSSIAFFCSSLKLV